MTRAAAGVAAAPTVNQSAVQNDQRAILDAKRRPLIGAPLDSCSVTSGRDGSRNPSEAVRNGAIGPREYRHGHIGRLHDAVYRQPDKGHIESPGHSDQLA